MANETWRFVASLALLNGRAAHDGRIDFLLQCNSKEPVILPRDDPLNGTCGPEVDFDELPWRYWDIPLCAQSSWRKVAYANAMA